MPHWHCGALTVRCKCLKGLYAFWTWWFQVFILGECILHVLWLFYATKQKNVVSKPNLMHYDCPWPERTIAINSAHQPVSVRLALRAAKRRSGTMLEFAIGPGVHWTTSVSTVYSDHIDCSNIRLFLWIRSTSKVRKQFMSLKNVHIDVPDYMILLGSDLVPFRAFGPRSRSGQVRPW